jgi:hypothetical protein
LVLLLIVKRFKERGGVAGKGKRPCYIQSSQGGQGKFYASSGVHFCHAEITRRNTMPSRVNQERLATVVGRALIDKEFAAKLHADAEAAAKGIGVHLSATELTAVKNIDTVKLGTAGAGIRDKLGTAAIFDQQQQIQARMD